MSKTGASSKPDEVRTVAPWSFSKALSPPWDSRQATLLAGMVIALAAVAAYSNSLSGTFFFEDDKAICDNPSIRHFGDALFPPIRGEAVTGRPALNATLAVNYAMSGLNVWSYHVVNLLIHASAALVLFGVVRRTLLLPSLRRRWRDSATPLAFLIGLTWVVHPLQTESVTYVVQRAESLMGLLYLLTLYCFIRGVRSIRPRWWCAAAFFACLFGMATKEVMVSAPVIVFLYDRTFVAGTFREAWQRHRRLHLALASTWLLLMWLNMTGPSPVGFGVGIRWWDYVCTQFVAIVHYLRLCVWPQPLLIDYDGYVARGFWQVVPCGILVVSLGLATLLALWRWPKIGFLGLCFFAVLAPSSLVTPVYTHQTIAEHRMYLPLAAALVCIVAGSLRIGQWFVRGKWLSRRQSQALGAGIAASVVILFSVLTFQRNNDYQSARTLWNDVIAKAPYNARAYSNLGNLLVAQKESEQGIACLCKAIELDPNYARAHNNLGAALAKTGRVDDAMKCYRKALDIAPHYSDAFNNLGEALADRGRIDEAIVQFRKAIEYSPTHAAAYNNLGAALASRGQDDDAEFCYRKAIEYNPRCAGAYCNLGVLRVNRGQVADAVPFFRQALQYDGSLANAYNNLGAALASLGQLDEALDCYQKAIAFSLNPAEAYCNLGATLAGRGLFDQAEANVRKALDCQPDYADAHYHLGNLLANRGRRDEAVRCYQKALQYKPDHAEACHNLGVVETAQGRLDDAIANYRRAIAIQPDYASAHHHLAIALTKQARFAEANASYRKVVTLQPDAKYMASLALFLATCPDASLRNGREAVQLAGRAAELSRHNDPAILDSLAAAYAEAGRFDDARSTAQQAIELANRQGNVPLAALLRGRIALYEHGQPYREEDITLAPTSPPFP